MSDASVARRGGRPTRRAAAELGEKILIAATELFLTRGFGATSIEAIASRARISKRTLYHRFRDKPDLFRAVVQRLLQRWLPQFEAELAAPAPLAEMLTRVGRRMLAVALQPEALALRRLLLAEGERFPELAEITIRQGATRAIERIALLLDDEIRAGRLARIDSRFAATQFQEMVLAVPLRRAVGVGARLGEAELEIWVTQSVALFLHGCAVPRAEDA